MCKQVRSILFEDGSPFDGEVEVDEAYFGGGKSGKRERGAESKTPVVGMVERNGKLEAHAVDNTTRKTVIPMVVSNIQKSAQVFMDDFPVYDCLPSFEFNHAPVPHSEKIYVVGNCHTNTTEGFLSMVKNGIKSVYHSVSSKYLQFFFE